MGAWQHACDGTRQKPLARLVSYAYVLRTMAKLKPLAQPSGDQQFISDIADFFDLPPALIIEKAKFVLRSGDTVPLDTKVDRFSIEKLLGYGKQKGEQWAAASLGLTVDTLQKCYQHDALTDTPLPFGVISPRKRQSGTSDERKIFHLDQLADWASMLIESHMGHTITFSSVTGKAIRLRDALKSAGIDAQLQFCSFESKYLKEFCISEEDFAKRVVSSTLCFESTQPIWEGNGCWLENGKPISLKPDIISYEALLADPSLTSRVNRSTLEHFDEVVNRYGIRHHV